MERNLIFEGRNWKMEEQTIKSCIWKVLSNSHLKCLVKIGNQSAQVSNWWVRKRF